jgi:hypothetical protein
VRESKGAVIKLAAELAVVVVEGLEVLVDVGDGGGEAEVEGAEDAYVLVVLVLDELDDDVLVGLDLEHLEDEAEEGGGLARAAEGAAEVVELHGLVDERLGGEAEALLLPVGVLVDLRPHDLLHKVLRVRPVHVPRQRVRAVRHARSLLSSPLLAPPRLSYSNNSEREGTAKTLTLATHVCLTSLRFFFL